MRLEKKTKIIIKTKREFVIRHTTAGEQVDCPQCGGKMISERVGAEFFGISYRTIYRLVEAGEIHFSETDENVGLICLQSFGNNTDEYKKNMETLKKIKK